MSLFRSCNLLGTYCHDTDTLMQPMPQEVVSNGVLIATPLSNGGVMCARTTDLAKAMNRNWKFGDQHATAVGALFTLDFTGINDFGLVNFVPSLTGTVLDFQTGVSTGPGLDYTDGDPHLALTTPRTLSRLVIGTADQYDPVEMTIVSGKNVYYVPSFELEWHGMRWWDSTPGTDTLTGGFSMRFTGTVSPETDFEWHPDTGGLRGATPVYVSNWLVDLIDALAAWQLNTTPLGGSNYDQGLHGPHMADALAYFKWGNDAPTDSFPLRGYYEPSIEGQPTSDVLIEEAEIHFTKMLDPLPEL